MSSQFDKERVIELVGRLCDEEIGEDEVTELESVLAKHEEARRLYHLTVALHRDLELCDIGEVQLIQVAAEDASQVGTRPRSSKLWVSIAAACLLVAASFFGFQIYRGAKSTAPTIAAVTDMVDVEWGDGQSAGDVGEELAAGRVRLNSGTICLTFHHGVVMTVESPADLELLNKEHVALHSGQVVAYVPDGAEGFTVSTDKASVIDLGTEFAVTARQDGSSNVIVFDGEVDLALKDHTNSAPQRIVAGLAYRVDKVGASHQEEFRQEPYENARTLIRARKVIRETFRSDVLFPGKARKGWTGPWEISTDNFVIDEPATGIHTKEPLATESRNYLTVVGQVDSGSQPGSLQFTRGFESFREFDSTQPYTIEFLLRLESDPSAIDRIRVFGAHVPVDGTSDRSDWEIATPPQRDGEELRWQLYRPKGTRTNTLPIVRDQTYRFLIEVHPQQYRWRASISDGTNSIWNTLKDGGPLRLRRDEKTDRTSLGWELTGKPETELRFSLDAVRIQNHPTATENLEIDN